MGDFQIFADRPFPNLESTFEIELQGFFLVPRDLTVSFGKSL